jgi:hypothetical protein
VQKSLLGWHFDILLVDFSPETGKRENATRLEHKIVRFLSPRALPKAIPVYLSSAYGPAAIVVPDRHEKMNTLPVPWNTLQDFSRQPFMIERFSLH